LLSNLGNLDWRPCLNLWAVVEYITKYAMKAPKGSRNIGQVVREVMDEVGKYAPSDGRLDLLKKSCQKFYSRTVGDRDYGIFEAMHLGLQLPFVMPFMEVTSLNTLGARSFKSVAQQRAEGLGPDGPLTNDSMIDKFEKRAELVARQYARTPDVMEKHLDAVKNVSLYEFWYKFGVSRNRVYAVQSPRALAVKPGYSADCANVAHHMHEAYARMCVVAFWRLMPTVDRHKLIGDGVRRGFFFEAADMRRWGATPLVARMPQAGFAESVRFLGVRDLVGAFDGRRDRTWGHGLMEMLVDPVLVLWVPCWIVEQYDRWNPFFKESLDVVLGWKSMEKKGNSRVLRAVRRVMEAAAKKQKRVKGEGDDEGADQGSDGEASGAGTDPGDDVEQAAAAAMAPPS